MRSTWDSLLRRLRGRVIAEKLRSKHASSRFMLIVSLFGAMLVAATGAQAQQSAYYVRPGATGANTGADWANAFSSLPNSLARGATYYLADGSYGGRTLNTPNNGTAAITLKKCTAADHGTNSGYDSSYCDGQASFGDIILGSDYWIIDGSTRNEGNWANGSSYGIVIRGGIIGSTAITDNVCASHITVKYVNVGGADIGNTHDNQVDYAFKTAGFSESCINWTLSRNYVHNVNAPYHINGSDQGIIEYSYVAHGFGKEAVRGQIRMSNFTIRHNIFKDSCQGNQVDATGGACSATIGLFDGYVNSAGWANTKIYGNVFWVTNNASQQDGILVVGGSNDSVGGVEIYNNTFAGFKQGALQILVRGNGTCRNNLAHNMASAPSFSCSTSSNNIYSSTNPFIALSSGDLRLSAPTVAGHALQTPYNVDLLGNARGAGGVWDVGAYEYGAATASAPPAPSLPAPVNLVVR